MRREPVLLGIDIGTSGCKAMACTPDGEIVGSGYASYTLARPRRDHVEQDPLCWWRALTTAVSQAVAGLAPGALSGIGLSSTNALVLVGADGEPVRPAIMQLDRRAGAEAAALASRVDEQAWLGIFGAVPRAGTHWLPTLMWLREHEPRTWQRTTCLLYPSGWVAHRLTGHLAADHSRAATTLLLDQRARQWHLGMASDLGVPAQWLPVLQDASVTTGTLLPTAAGHLGLPAGIPVTVGSMDSAAAAVGVGAVWPHDAVVALGTTARVMAVTNAPRPGAEVVTCPFPGLPYYLGIAVVWGAGSAVQWVARRWTGEPDYARLDAALADGRPPGHRRGHVDVQDFAAPSGEAPSPEDADEYAVSIVDAVVSALADKAGELESTTRSPIARYVVTGGASRSPALVQRLTAALGARAATCGNPDAETRGAAILASVAAGVHPDVPTASRAFCSARPVPTPPVHAPP